jgi:hypothetical protein
MRFWYPSECRLKKIYPVTFSLYRTAAFSPRMSKSSGRNRIIFTGTVRIYFADKWTSGTPVRVESKKLPLFKVGKELMERVDY